MTTVVDQRSAYGIDRPTSEDAVAMFRKVFGGRGDAVWTDLHRRASVTRGDEGLDALGRLAATALADDDPAVSLCGRAMQIWLGSFQRLAAVRALVAGVA